MAKEANSTFASRPEPYWRDSISIPEFPALSEDIDVDVAIVGGGISGITAAYLLSSEGLKVALLEADKLLNGSTGHTTAKITAQHNLLYDELIQHTGKCKAKRYYESNQDAIRFIEKTSQELGIDCEFQSEDAYVYSITDEYAKKIEKEFSAYRMLGIDGDVVKQIPLPIDVQNAIVMRNQAQYHPLKYLMGLVDILRKKGVQIYEHTVATDVEYGERPVIVTRHGHRISADKVLACSHFPFYDGAGFYFTRMYAKRAYIIAAKCNIDYPGGMYISAETPAISLRSVQIDNEQMLLISGADHKTGQGKDTMEHYQSLEAYGREVLGLTEVRYRWSNQDLFTLDKIPFIGELTQSHPNVLVATGYKKWGMTSSVVAAQLLRDIVMDRENPYRDVYDPSRFYADPSLRKFLSTNINVAAHLIKGKFEVSDLAADDLAPGEGAVITHDGRRAGAYRDDDGQVYIVDTTCTHLGCEVNWNHGDKTWDCPCHGSRFAVNGDVIEGPAEKPLERLD